MSTDVHDIEYQTIDGETATLGQYEGHAVLVVNVASECGLTPQYAGLQELADEYRDRGFFVLGAPCNQFMGQEPGDEAAIKEFTSEKYGITFPLTAKLDVNGPGRHPLFEVLTSQPDADGKAGDVEWNFEKFLISPEGEVVARFRPSVDPGDPAIADALEDVLPI